jgi:hypothetical protein
MRSFFAIFSALVLLSACESNAVKTVTIDNKFSLDVPEFLEETTLLNDEAILQYHNAAKEFYVIVIEENADTFNLALSESELTETYTPDLTGYANLVFDILTRSIAVTNKTDFKDVKINGLDSRQLEFDGSQEGIGMFGNFSVIRGKVSYYQVFTWTLDKNKSTYSEKMSKMVNSFKEV